MVLIYIYMYIYKDIRGSLSYSSILLLQIWELESSTAIFGAEAGHKISAPKQDGRGGGLPGRRLLHVGSSQSWNELAKPDDANG